MRIKSNHIIAIQKTFLDYFGSDDHLWLFGSRADDAKFGGDIDLYIETQKTDAEWVMNTRQKFVSSLRKLIGDQKIDVVIKRPDANLPIYKIAKETGVLLI